jgi:hypothetical protein
MTNDAPPPKKDYVEALLQFLTPQHTQEYWASLGEFVSTFSIVEVNMQLALWEFAGLSRPLAIALLAGSTRIDSAINLMSKISVARKWKAARKRELQTICTQLGIINKVRNDILHYGARFTKGEWVVSNRALAATQKRTRITKFTVRALKDMTKDLMAINSRVVYLAWGSFMKPKTRRSFTQVRHHAWRYKPPSKAVRGRKNRKTPQTRKPRRGPSQG